MAAAVRAQADSGPHQQELPDIVEPGNALKSRIEALITDPAQAATLTNRIVDQHGNLPLFGNALLSADPAFMDALNQRNAILARSTLKEKTASIRALIEKHSAHTPLSPEQVGSLLESLHGTSIIQDDQAHALRILYEQGVSFRFQLRRLNSLIENFNMFLQRQQLPPLPLPVGTDQS